MSVAVSIREAESQLDASKADSLVRNIGIPPRPQTLADLQREIGQADPDFRRIAALVAADVALTAALLRVVNSPAFAASRRIETISQAIAMLGLKQVGALVAGLLLRKALRTDGPTLTRFWDVSSKRSYAMAKLARGLGGVDADLAHSFGLFCDVGIPLLLQRFPDYAATLKAANEAPVDSFTTVEHAAHQTDHALVGGLMARSWGLSQSVGLAIRLHHDYAIFRDRDVPDVVSKLIAMGLVAEHAIQRFAGMNASTEWSKGGDAALGALMLTEHEFDDWTERLLEGFALGTA